MKLCYNKKKPKQTLTKRFKDKKDKLLPKKKGTVQSSKTGECRHCCILPPQTSQGGLSKNPTLAAACRSRVLKAATTVLISFLALQDFSCCHCWQCWDGERERLLQISLLHLSLQCFLLPTGAMATAAQTPREMCKGALPKKVEGDVDEQLLVGARGKFL